MDVFKEYIVKRELTSGERTSKIFIMIASVALAACFVVFTIGTYISMIGILLAGISIYFGYQVITKMFIEYEYIITNADLDIDKIVNQSKRNRLCTINLHEVTECGKFTENVTIGEDETVVKANANNPELEDYYLRFTHREYGKAILVFTPSTEFIGLAKPFFPRNAKNYL
jgi:hypothetical protein